MRHTVLVGALCIFSTLFTPLSQAAESHVVTSIKPLELLVRAVATDNVQVTSLVPAGASPHTYQMRPSQRQALESADLIFWIGEDMETFLIRLLSGDEFRSRSIALMAAADPDHPHEESQHAEHHETEHHHNEQHHDDEHRHSDHHGHGDEGQDQDHDKETHHDDHDHGDGEDPHVWLDPELALAMAHTIHDRLATLPDANTSELNENLEQFEQRLRQAEADIRQQLAAAKELDLFTYHDAFRRFAEHYGLKIEGVLTLSPERSPGARHIAEVQQELAASDQPCLLTEPQFNRQWWRSITEGMDLTFSTWDPLAGEIEADSEGYVEFQYAMANAVLACLPE